MLAFSADGTTLAGYRSSGVTIWSLDGAARPSGPLQPKRWETALAFSPDGRTLASAAVGTADYDTSVRLWNVATGVELLPALGGHDGPVRALAFSPGGTLLAAGEYERVVLWQLERRQRIGQPLTGHDGPIEALTFSPDGHWLASGGYDDRVLLWDLRPDSWRRRACAMANRYLGSQRMGSPRGRPTVRTRLPLTEPACRRRAECARLPAARVKPWALDPRTLSSGM